MHHVRQLQLLNCKGLPKCVAWVKLEEEPRASNAQVMVIIKTQTHMIESQCRRGTCGLLADWSEHLKLPFQMCTFKFVLKNDLQSHLLPIPMWKSRWRAWSISLVNFSLESTDRTFFLHKYCISQSFCSFDWQATTYTSFTSASVVSHKHAGFSKSAMSPTHFPKA